MPSIERVLSPFDNLLRKAFLTNCAEIEKSIRFANANGEEDYGFDIDPEDNNSESLDISDDDVD